MLMWPLGENHFDTSGLKYMLKITISSYLNVCQTKEVIANFLFAKADKLF